MSKFLTKKSLLITISVALTVCIAVGLILFFTLREKPPVRETYFYGDFEYSILDDGRKMQFRVVIQDRGLAVSNIHIDSSDEETLHRIMTTYHPG